MTKIDLEELERIAKACLPASADPAAHIDANSPRVTLALIARIRELEAGLGRLAVRGTPQATWIRALLDKGVVVP